MDGSRRFGTMNAARQRFDPGSIRAKRGHKLIIVHASRVHLRLSIFSHVVAGVLLHILSPCWWLPSNDLLLAGPQVPKLRAPQGGGCLLRADGPGPVQAVRSPGAQLVATDGAPPPLRKQKPPSLVTTTPGGTLRGTSPATPGISPTLLYSFCSSRTGESAEYRLWRFGDVFGEICTLYNFLVVSMIPGVLAPPYLERNIIPTAIPHYKKQGTENLLNILDIPANNTRKRLIRQFRIERSRRDYDESDLYV